MSFLSIAFLTALPLLAAPVLLHLFDRQRNVVIGWGAMQFLMEAATQQRSARRIQHWLLLLVRVAALAALILALARPLLHSSLLPASGPTELIIVLDNSMSTLRSVDDSRLWDRIVERAQRLIGDAPGEAKVRVLAASPYPTWLLAAGVSTSATAEDWSDQLRKLQPTMARSDLQGALLKAIDSRPDSESVSQRRIVLLTDGQANDWQAEDRAGWSRLRTALATAPIPTWLDVQPLDEQAGAEVNLAVDLLRATHTILGVDQPVTVTAQVRNHGSAESLAAEVQWLVDGQAVHSSSLAPLQPDAAADTSWTGSLPSTGVFTLTCRIDADDALDADNQESLVVEVVDRVPVLLIEGAAELADMQQDAYLVQAALGRIEGQWDDGWRAVFEPRTIPPERLESIELDDYRAIVIPHLSLLGPVAIERLDHFVARGGGLWIALGPRTDVSAFNRLLFRDGSGLSPVGIDRLVDESRASAQRPTLNPFLKHHPATITLADDQRLDTGAVKVSQRFRLRMPEGYTHVPVLMDLSNGEPLAIERSLGQGRVIVQAIPLRLQWSELAVSQAFVVMVHDWLTYLSEPTATRYNLAAGQPIRVQLADVDHTNASLRLPGGEDIAVPGQRVDGGVLFQTSRTVLPGTYALEVGIAGDAIPFHVPRDGAESDLRPLASDQLAELVELRDSEIDAAAGGRIGDGRRSTPIWSALLMLLIALVLADLLLSGRLARQRFGAAGIDEQAGSLAIPPSHLAQPATTAPRSGGAVVGATNSNRSFPSASRRPDKSVAGKTI